MTLSLTPRQRQTLIDHAAREAPTECCGVLVGRPVTGGWIVASVVAGRNIASTDRQRRYVIDPKILLETHRQAREQGAEVIGYYHSHPRDRAEPSAEDARHAWAGVSYLIVGKREPSGTDDTGFELRSWRFETASPRERPARFVEEPVVIDEAGAKLAESRHGAT